MIGHRLGVLDSPSYRPFINAFKQAWPWQADSGGTQWGSLVSGGHMRTGGQLLRIAPGSNGYRTRLFHNMPAQAGGTGRWRLRWNGQCTWDVYGASNVTRAANEIQFDFTANGSSWVDMVVRTIGSEVSGISLAHESDWADQDAGRIFRRQFVQELAGSRALRFDEWIGILRSENEGGLRITSWESRGLPSDEIFYRFVPYEWMCALANEVGAEPWICLPTAATDDHFRKAAELVHGLVPAPRRVHVEYSTKTWDFSGTPQAHYCSDRGRAAFNTTDGAAFRNWYGMRATQMALIWKDVWQNDPRLRTVVQHQADWVGGEVDILEAPLWRSRSGQNGLPAYVAPHSVLDMLTVHAQIDGGMAYGGGAGQIDTWRTTLSQAEAFNRMRDRLLTGSADRTVRVMTPKWRHYRNVASGYGMGLSSYEVGNHLNGIGGSQATRDFVHAFSVSAQMGEVYEATFNALEAEGFDGPLCMSVDCRLPDANISHGLQRWLGDHNPAWAAVDALIEDAPVVVPPVEPDPEEPPVDPEPEQPPVEPEPEEPNMADRDKLKELLSILKTTTADLENYLSDAQEQPPVEEPEPQPTAPDPVLTVPSSVTAPSGQNVIRIPVAVSNTDKRAVTVTCYRAQNANPATINVGTGQVYVAAAATLIFQVGDALTKDIVITLPGASYRDGQQVIYHFDVNGATPARFSVMCTFRDVPATEPTPEPEPEQPSAVPAGYRATQDFKIDKDLQFDWSTSGGVNIFLPNWAGGDTGNGVGGSVGTPRRVLYNDDKSLTITAGMEEGRWRNGALQLNRPTSAIGKWGAVVTSHTGDAVNAFFSHADNGKELDFELVKRNGVIGWAPAVHMPRTGGGRASSNRRTLALGEFKAGVQQRLEFELFADRCVFSVDGVVFETVTHADMASGFIWDTTTRMATFATIERHAGWAGWNSTDYAKESRMTVHGFLLPTMP